MEENDRRNRADSLQQQERTAELRHHKNDDCDGATIMSVPNKRAHQSYFLKGAPTGAAGWVSAQVTNEIKNEKKIASAATEGRSNLCERLVKKM
ncbi:hypothetical protein QTP88_016303 [Uroleucon formosanum]